MKKLRDLNSRKNRNILKLEIDETIISNLPKISRKGVTSLKALNSPSPRFSSFINPALLGSPNRSVKML
jgi:hypothetical protein